MAQRKTSGGPPTDDSVEMIVRLEPGRDIREIALKLEALGLSTEIPRRGGLTLGVYGQRALMSQIAGIDGIARFRETVDFALPPMSDKLPQ